MIALVLSAALLVLSCSPPRGQFYPDSYYPEDRIYENKPLGITLTYKGNWTIAANPAEMNRSGRRAARSMHAAGGELLFTGTTLEGTQGTRGVAENLNVTEDKYLEMIRRSNSATIEEDLGKIGFLAGDHLVVKWQYLYSGLRFVEFLFCNGTYNIRIAFWTSPELFERFLPVYEDIMASLTIRQL
jgi:hypothetical protein